jgi:hypothetical protein
MTPIKKNSDLIKTSLDEIPRSFLIIIIALIKEFSERKILIENQKKLNKFLEDISIKKGGLIEIPFTSNKRSVYFIFKLDASFRRSFKCRVFWSTLGEKDYTDTKWLSRKSLDNEYLFNNLAFFLKKEGSILYRKRTVFIKNILKYRKKRV